VQELSSSFCSVGGNIFFRHLIVLGNVALAAPFTKARLPVKAADERCLIWRKDMGLTFWIGLILGSFFSLLTSIIANLYHDRINVSLERFRLSLRDTISSSLERLRLSSRDKRRDRELSEYYIVRKLVTRELNETLFVMRLVAKLIFSSSMFVAFFAGAVSNMSFVIEKDVSSISFLVVGMLTASMVFLELSGNVYVRIDTLVGRLLHYSKYEQSIEERWGSQLVDVSEHGSGSMDKPVDPPQ
jgi:hypothetical protein